MKEGDSRHPSCPQYENLGEFEGILTGAKTPGINAVRFCRK